MMLTPIQRDILETAANPAHQYVTVSLTHEATLDAVTSLLHRGYLILRDGTALQANYFITMKGRQALKEGT